MSSSSSTAALVLALGISGLGCSRPPPPRPPVQMVRVEAPCNCEEDEEYPDDEPRGLVASKSVEYVRLSEWQPPSSAQRVEAEIEPRGNEPPSYLKLPDLKLHKAIGETTVHIVPRIVHGGALWIPPYPPR